MARRHPVAGRLTRRGQTRKGAPRRPGRPCQGARRLGSARVSTVQRPQGDLGRHHRVAVGDGVRGRHPAQVRSRCMRVRLRTWSRSFSGAATMVLCSCCRMARRQQTAVLRVVRSARSASTAPERSLATLTRWPVRAASRSIARDQQGSRARADGWRSAWTPRITVPSGCGSAESRTRSGRDRRAGAEPSVVRLRARSPG